MAVMVVMVAVIIEDTITVKCPIITSFDLWESETYPQINPFVISIIMCTAIIMYTLKEWLGQYYSLCQQWGSALIHMISIMEIFIRMEISSSLQREWNFQNKRYSPVYYGNLVDYLID